MAKTNKKAETMRVYIISIAIALGFVALTYLLVFFVRYSTSPNYLLTVEGLSAQTPSQAQSACRKDNAEYKRLSEEYPDSSFVWCGEDTIYIVKDSRLKIDKSAPKYSGFTSVSFNIDYKTLEHGYIIDPTADPVVAAEIALGESETYNAQLVGMTIRTAMRDGTVNYEDVIYLWQDGSTVVYAVKTEAVTLLDNGYAQFTDDGSVLRFCHVLDTQL